MTLEDMPLASPPPGSPSHTNMHALFLHPIVFYNFFSVTFTQARCMFQYREHNIPPMQTLTWGCAKQNGNNLHLSDTIYTYR